MENFDWRKKIAVIRHEELTCKEAISLYRELRLGKLGRDECVEARTEISKRLNRYKARRGIIIDEKYGKRISKAQREFLIDFTAEMEVVYAVAGSSPFYSQTRDEQTKEYIGSYWVSKVTLESLEKKDILKRMPSDPFIVILRLADSLPFSSGGEI